MKIFWTIFSDWLDGSFDFVENGSWYKRTALWCQAWPRNVGENCFSYNNAGPTGSWTGSQSHSMVGHHPQRRRGCSTTAPPHFRPLEGNVAIIISLTLTWFLWLIAVGFLRAKTSWSRRYGNWAAEVRERTPATRWGTLKEQREANQLTG